jgi:tetratricopeptide (TPR) repeat protein
MHARVFSALSLFLLANLALAAPLDDAIALYKERKLTEARLALETITAAEPKNAAACYYLGLTLVRTHDPALLENAVSWFDQAVQLEPTRTDYLFEYGGSSLDLAKIKHSLGAATRGREALEKLLTLDPDHLDAHEALYQFFGQAPWPLGSASKANAHLEAIQKRDPDRARLLAIVAKTNAKDFAAAFQLCSDGLVQKPDDYNLSLQYGRIAIISGQNLETALATLRRCLGLTPPPKSPGPAFVHWRIGAVLEKMGDKDGARKAYETSVELDPHFTSASDSLNKLKQN